MRWLLLLVILLPFAGAQDAVYFTNASTATGVNNIAYEASQEVPADGKAYAAFGQAATTYTTTFAGTLDNDYEPGAWELRIFLSCDEPTVYRPTSTADTYRPSLSATMTLGGYAFPVQYGESTLRTCDGPDDIWELVFAVDGSQAVPTAGASFQVDVNVWWLNPPPGAAQNGYFVLGSEGSGLFGLTQAQALLPDVEIGAFNGSVSQVFEEATTASYQFTYNATALEQLNHTLTTTAGSAAWNLTDANGTILAETGAANGTLNGTAGPWMLSIEYVDFVGSFDLQLAPTSPIQPGNATPDQTPVDQQETPPQGNETADETPDEESPATLAPLAVVLAVWLARRRDT